MSKTIYSIFEIEKKASLINADRELKKDWLSKSMELVSSKTVLKDIKLGEQELKKVEKASEEFEKLIFIQEAIGYFYMGNIRANGKDRKAFKSLEENIEVYHSLLFRYFLDIYQNIEMYQLNYEILEEIAFALREGNNRLDVREVLNQYEKNKVIYDFYLEIIELKEDSIEKVRKKYKEYIAESSLEFAIVVKERLASEFKIKREYLNNLINNEENLKKAEKIEMQKSLKFISYFNTSLYLKFKNIIYKYFSLLSTRQYFENEYTYIDYQGIDRIFKTFSSFSKNSEKNQLIMEEEIKQKKTLLKYSDAYIFYNLNLFFDFSSREFFIENLFKVERFIRAIENEDRLIMSHLVILREIENIIEIQRKIEEIIKLLELSQLTFKNELLKRLYYIHFKNKKKLDLGNEFKLIIKDIENNKNYYFIKKEEVYLGRNSSNEIRINSKYVSRRHLKIHLNNGTLLNYEKDGKSNISYINNNSKENIREKNFYFDDIKEINIGNVFTFKVEPKENYIELYSFLDKSNKAFLETKEIEDFSSNHYILIKNLNKCYLDIQKSCIYTKEKRVNKNDIKIDFVNWPSLKIANDMESTLQLGENILADNLIVYFEKM